MLIKPPLPRILEGKLKSQEKKKKLFKRLEERRIK